MGSGKSVLIVVTIVGWIVGVTWFAYAFLQPKPARIVYASSCEASVGFCGWYRVDYYRRRVSVVLRTYAWPSSVVFWVRDVDPTYFVYAGFAPDEKYTFSHEWNVSENAWLLRGLRRSFDHNDDDDDEYTIVTLVYRMPPEVRSAPWSDEEIVRRIRIETTLGSTPASGDFPRIPIARATDRALHARADEDVSCEGEWVPEFGSSSSSSTTTRCYEGRRTDVYRVRRTRLNDGTPCPYADGDRTSTPCDDD